MPDGILRRLGIADLECLVRLERAQSHPWTRGQLETTLTDGSVCVLGIESGGELSGHAVVARLPFEAELQAMLVAPDKRRRGLAARLLVAVIEQARRWGSERLLLEVRASNRAAIGLYRSTGFEEDGRRRAYYPAIPGEPAGPGRGTGAPREDAVLMSRRL
ncbi:ribosomal protein S18-alanine N-acetyltransferase [Billgrantia endophytica]|uniref:Ribosomal-protein-alanine N-acetyltransferase n=1 Tax=Billgrantia endophytica TaxID=2033802 RepID=A0A2N7U718_9GAMM|nr:ribosomal protein S18-alanine N-acetyltransferase [Halomonas endophytica]PMR76227.1 ribosomal-protein-alanine N-acetyltransferase [Halomonas endophytica]